jgi:hypothetical protein
MLPFLDIRVDRPTEYGTGERPRDWPRWQQEIFENDLLQFRGVLLVVLTNGRQSKLGRIKDAADFSNGVLRCHCFAASANLSLRCDPYSSPVGLNAQKFTPMRASRVTLRVLTACLSDQQSLQKQRSS